MIAPLEDLLATLSRLPGIGRRSAERIAFFLLAKPEEGRRLTATLAGLDRITRCPRCGNFATDGPCAICRDPKRDGTTLCTVARPWEIPHIEKTGEYRGRYHVLGGLISPSQDIGPDDLAVASLVERVKVEGVREVILALEPKLDGDLTAMHLLRVLKPLGIAVSQLAHGIPVGRDLESADELTLGRALKGRTQL
jgi:recombination protein RecR